MEENSPLQDGCHAGLRTSSCHNRVHSGGHELNKAECVATVVIIRVSGTKIPWLSKHRDTQGDRGLGERTHKKSMSKKVMLRALKGATVIDYNITEQHRPCERSQITLPG